jgi:hypothetical protein
MNTKNLSGQVLVIHLSKNLLSNHKNLRRLELTLTENLLSNQKTII